MMSSNQKGMYGKYEVFKDGERVTEDCFVLIPSKDMAARAALSYYARETKNSKLASDLREWLRSLKPKGTKRF